LNNVRKVYPEYDGWSPENFEKDSIGGEVAMWYALAHSMNIPTVDLYFRTGADTIRDTFKALGLPTDGVDNPALALGAADISLQEIVQAYSAFANSGLVHGPQFIERITEASGKVIYQGKVAAATRALDEDIAETITAMLRRVVDQGTGVSIRSRFGVRSALAGKTGTSQDFSDAWFMAYTPGLVMGTWVGARDPGVHFVSGLGTGAQLALPIIGTTLAEMQRSSAMRKHYLVSFPAEDDVDMSCDPRRFPSLVDKIFEGLLDPSKRTSHEGKEPDKKDEKEGFFRRLFPKK
jgi:penicillin-binding protein 1A